MRPPQTDRFAGRVPGRALSAALLASAMMAASPAMAQSLTVSGTTVTVVDEVQTYENVALTNSGLITGDGTGEISASGTYNMQSGTVYQVNLSGSARLIKSGSGTVILTGENVYTGSTDVQRGVLQIGDGTSGSLGETAVTVSGTNARLDINLAEGGVLSNSISLSRSSSQIRFIGANLNTVSGIISGSGSLRQYGTGTTVLTGSNSYRGDTIVSSGTLQIGDGVTGSIRSSSDVDIASNGTLVLNLASGSNFSNDVDNDGLVKVIGSGTTTVSSDIGGYGDFEQAGSGLTILTGSNTYRGDTLVTSGTLRLGNGSSFSTSLRSTSDVLVSEGATFELNLRNNRELRSDIVNDGLVRAIASGTNTFDGEISGTGAFEQAGTGVTVFDDDNSYTGSTTILSGTLKAGRDNVMSANSAVYVDSEGTLDIRNTRQTIASLADGENGGGQVRISNGRLAVGYDNTDTSFSGTINGFNGRLRKIGTGTLTLTGSNSYSGDTEIREGTLQIGDGVSGSISSFSDVEISENATLALNLADESFFENRIENDGLINSIADGTTILTGKISGSGSFFQDGTGRTILTGSNSYTGETYVLQGTLQIGDGMTYGSSIGNSSYVEVSEGATLDIRLADGDAFSNDVTNNGTVHSYVSGGYGFVPTELTNYIGGQISGIGGFVKEGTGTTVFSNTNQHTYSGATEILEGTLRTDSCWQLSSFSDHQVSAGAILDINDTEQEVGMLTGEGTVTLGWCGDAELYVGSSGLSGDFYGNIKGRGYVSKVGEGIWSLYGDSTFRGDLEIQEGALALYGSVKANIHNNALFYGAGTAKGDVHNRGILVGGGVNGPGVLKVKGNFFQFEDGIYLVNALSSSHHSKIDVDGYAEISGGLVLATSGNYTPHRKDKLTVLEAAGGIEGQFDTFENHIKKTMLKPKVVYKDDSVVIEFEQKKFTSLSGLTPNQKALARALNSVSKKSGLIDKLNSLDFSDVDDVIALLSPEQLAVIFNTGFATAQLQFTNIERRLDDVRNGTAGFSTNGLALSNSHGTLSYDGMPIVNERDGLTLAGWDGKSIVSKQAVAPVVTESRWSFYATGLGEWADVETVGDRRGSDFRTGGVNIGADYRVNENLILGITAGYANTKSNLWDGGDVKINSGRGALYGTWFSDGFYVNALAGGAYNSYDTRRSTLGGYAHGSPDGGEFDGLFGLGYDFCVGGFTVGPVASLRYTYIELDSYTESGSDAPLHFNKQQQESLQSAVGLKATYTFAVGGVTLTPEVRAQWLHEYGDSTAAVESRFAAGGSAFTVNGPEIGRDGVLVDAGVTARFSPGFSVYAYYTGELARDNYNANGVNGGFRIDF